MCYSVGKIAGSLGVVYGWCFCPSMKQTDRHQVDSFIFRTGQSVWSGVSGYIAGYDGIHTCIIQKRGSLDGNEDLVINQDLIQYLI